MEAILYTIKQEGGCEPFGIIEKNSSLSPKEAYELGYQAINQTVKKARVLYNEIMVNFQSYGNISYQHTMMDELPEFFKWYDVKFNPQSERIFLDYPILSDLRNLRGIDRIYPYLKSIKVEQKFLGQFPPKWIVETLTQYHPDHEELLINLCQVLLKRIFCCMLLERKIQPDILSRDDCFLIERLVSSLSSEELAEKLTDFLKMIVFQINPKDPDLLSYLSNSIPSLSYELINACKNHNLYHEYIIS